jgi:hypothetical protein
MDGDLNIYGLRDLRRAAMCEGWLPVVEDLPELEELRARHATALATFNAAADQRAAVTRRHEAERKKRHDSMIEQARGGQVPDVAPGLLEEQDAEVRAADQVLKAARTAFDQELRQINSDLRAIVPAADALIQSRWDEAEEARRKAQELLDAANARVQEVLKLNLWFDRAVPERGHVNGALKSAIAWDQMEPPPVPVRPDPMLARALGHGDVIGV